MFHSGPEKTRNGTGLFRPEPWQNVCGQRKPSAKSRKHRSGKRHPKVLMCLKWEQQHGDSQPDNNKSHAKLQLVRLLRALRMVTCLCATCCANRDWLAPWCRNCISNSSMQVRVPGTSEKRMQFVDLYTAYNKSNCKVHISSSTTVFKHKKFIKLLTRE